MTARFLRTLDLMAPGATSIPSAGAAGASPGPIAEDLCFPTATLTQRLRAQYGTDRSWQGERSPDQIMELWEDPKGEWVLMASYASGKACIVAMGSGLGGFVPF